jgi:hypothetical protein
VSPTEYGKELALTLVNPEHIVTLSKICPNLVSLDMELPQLASENLSEFVSSWTPMEVSN